MSALLLTAAVITAVLFGYLFFALLYPEKLQ
jgi:K+-transporting ATPase KdpF subunit